MFVGIVILLTCSNLSSSATLIGKEAIPATGGNTLYVGGSGPGNYTKIQDAINDSRDGDTVFVYSGLYHEEIMITHPIRLLGQAKETTIIHPKTKHQNNLIALDSDNITISGFTCEAEFNILYNLLFNVKDLTVKGNIFKSNESELINLNNPIDCYILNNTFTTGGDAIIFYNGDNCFIENNSITSHISVNTCIIANSGDLTITNNTITNFCYGMNLESTNVLQISHNVITNISCLALDITYGQDTIIAFNIMDNTGLPHINSFMAIQLERTDYTTILRNLIQGFTFGIFLDHSFDVLVKENTFEHNIVNARFINTYQYNKWQNNYWGRPHILPKPIIGLKYTNHPYPGFVQFDWHPALHPYTTLKTI